MYHLLGWTYQLCVTLMFGERRIMRGGSDLAFKRLITHGAGQGAFPALPHLMTANLFARQQSKLTEPSLFTQREGVRGSE